MSDDKKDTATDPTAYGNMARMWCDDVTGVHVKQAQELQKKKPELRLGDAMVELGMMDEAQQKAVAEAQLRIRRGKARMSDVKTMLAYATAKLRRIATGG